MATAKKQTDKFANVAWLDVSESAANTLTFNALSLANNLMDTKFAMIIHRAEISVLPSQFNGHGDNVTVALTLSDRLTSLQLSQPEVLFYKMLWRNDTGTAASSELLEQPLVVDFTDLPGSGLIVPADRLYIACVGAGCAAANNAGMRVYYTVMPLETSDYWELIEARRIMTT